MWWKWSQPVCAPPPPPELWGHRVGAELWATSMSFSTPQKGLFKLVNCPVLQSPPHTHSRPPALVGHDNTAISHPICLDAPVTHFHLRLSPSFRCSQIFGTCLASVTPTQPGMDRNSSSACLHTPSPCSLHAHSRSLACNCGPHLAPRLQVLPSHCKSSQTVASVSEAQDATC